MTEMSFTSFLWLGSKFIGAHCILFMCILFIQRRFQNSYILVLMHLFTHMCPQTFNKVMLYIRFVCWPHWSPCKMEQICCCYSVAQSCPTLWPHGLQYPGFPVLHHLPEFAQTHVHWVSDAIQPSHLLLSPSLPSIFSSIRIFSNESALHLRWTDMHTINYKKRVESTLTGLC